MIRFSKRSSLLSLFVACLLSAAPTFAEALKSDTYPIHTVSFENSQAQVETVSVFPGGRIERSYVQKSFAKAFKDQFVEHFMEHPVIHTFGIGLALTLVRSAAVMVSSANSLPLGVVPMAREQLFANLSAGQQNRLSRVRKECGDSFADALLFNFTRPKERDFKSPACKSAVTIFQAGDGGLAANHAAPSVFSGASISEPKAVLPFRPVGQGVYPLQSTAPGADVPLSL